MSTKKSLCLTCLSNTYIGVAIPRAIVEFMCNVLKFKFARRRGISKFVCLTCYKTLSEMKRFYVQLQDVEHYFNQTINGSKSSPTQSKMAQNSTPVRNLPKKGVEVDEADDGSEHDGSLSESAERRTSLACEEVFLETEIPTKPIIGSPYKCEKCFRIFDNADACRTHFQWHLSRDGDYDDDVAMEETYECEICGKCFSSASQKRAHKLIHTNLKPFKCNICPKAYRQPNGLSAHQTVHFGKKFECPSCGKRFATKYEVKRHMNVHRDKEIVCKGCMKIFSTTEDLQSHKLRCELCEKSYCNQQTLDQHVGEAHQLGDETENSNDNQRMTAEFLVSEEEANV